MARTAVNTKAPDMTMTIEEIGPKKAQEYLKLNIHNPRHGQMSRSVIRRYAELMKAALWELNGEAIQFDEEGFLKNGQHRLAAIILSGVTVKMAVIRGVGKDVMIYDGGYIRTVGQNVGCNSAISATASLIVNNFKQRKGRGFSEQYINDHISELERAFRITCYGSGPDTKSKCAPCIAATYLAIRTDAIPSYELELFFRIFNSHGNCHSDGYDISPVIVARKMFDERGSFSSGYQIQKEKLEIIVTAMQDFHNGIGHTDNYKISEPFHFSEWRDEVRRKDGLDR